MKISIVEDASLAKNVGQEQPARYNKHLGNDNSVGLGGLPNEDGVVQLTVPESTCVQVDVMVTGTTLMSVVVAVCVAVLV